MEVGSHEDIWTHVEDDLAVMFLRLILLPNGAATEETVVDVIGLNKSHNKS